MIKILTVLFILTFSLAAQGLKWEEKTFTHKAKLDEKGVSFSFKARNTGSSDVVISKGRSSCACMTVKNKFPVTVKAGDSVEIMAYYDFTGKLGLNKGTVYMTIDGKRDELRVEIDIPIPVVVNPRFLIWKKNDLTTKDVNIAVHPDYKGSIDSAECKDKSMGVVAALTKTKKGYSLKITPPSGGLSKKRTWITVAAKDDKGKSQEYRIYLIFN